MVQPGIALPNVVGVVGLVESDLAAWGPVGEFGANDVGRENRLRECLESRLRVLDDMIPEGLEASDPGLPSLEQDIDLENAHGNLGDQVADWLGFVWGIWLHDSSLAEKIEILPSIDMIGPTDVHLPSSSIIALLDTRLTVDTIVERGVPIAEKAFVAADHIAVDSLRALCTDLVHDWLLVLNLMGHELVAMHSHPENNGKSDQSKANEAEVYLALGPEQDCHPEVRDHVEVEVEARYDQFDGSQEVELVELNQVANVLQVKPILKLVLLEHRCRQVVDIAVLRLRDFVRL